MSGLGFLGASLLGPSIATGVVSAIAKSAAVSANSDDGKNKNGNSRPRSDNNDNGSRNNSRGERTLRRREPQEVEEYVPEEEETYEHEERMDGMSFGFCPDGTLGMSMYSGHSRTVRNKTRTWRPIQGRRN